MGAVNVFQQPACSAVGELPSCGGGARPAQPGPGWGRGGSGPMRFGGKELPGDLWLCTARDISYLRAGVMHAAREHLASACLPARCLPSLLAMPCCCSSFLRVARGGRTCSTPPYARHAPRETETQAIDAAAPAPAVRDTPGSRGQPQPPSHRQGGVRKSVRQPAVPRAAHSSLRSTSLLCTCVCACVRCGCVGERAGVRVRVGGSRPGDGLLGRPHALRRHPPAPRLHPPPTSSTLLSTRCSRMSHSQQSPAQQSRSSRGGEEASERWRWRGARESRGRAGEEREAGRGERREDGARHHGGVPGTDRLRRAW